MVAVVEICESYDSGGETIEHDIANLNFGSIGAPEIVVATHPITCGTNSFVKYIRMHWTSGTANKLDNFQVWKSAGAYKTEETIQCNLEIAAYTAETYATPVATTYTHNAMPTSDPGAANIGIGGALAGNLVAVGYSDYIKMQLQTTVNTEAGNANQKTFTFQYDEQ